MHKHILLIEDDTMLSEMYTMVLQDEGFAVTHLKDGRAAVSRDLTDVDLVLLDIRIPEVDGLEVLKNYRERQFKRPIIVLTNSPQVDLDQVRALGATDFLIKSHTDIQEVVDVVYRNLKLN